jgi:hypothetical protein
LADRYFGVSLSISPSGLNRFPKEAHGNPSNWYYILMNEVDLFVKTKNQTKNQVLRGPKSVEMEK